MTTTQKIEKLEHIWLVDVKYKDFDINETTGFITPKGKVISIGDRQHFFYMQQFKEKIGMDEIGYFKAYGAIRIRPASVFIFMEMPHDSLNVEIHKKPTPEQIETLLTIKSKVFYDFFGDEVKYCSKDGVSAEQFIKDLKKYWKV